MNEPANSRETEEEINSGQLFVTLIEQWKLIGTSTLLTATIGFFVGSATPYSATVEIKPLQSREVAAFRQLNDYLLNSKLVPATADGKPPLSPDRFLTELIAGIDDSDLFRAVASEVRKTELRELDEAAQVQYLASLRGGFTLRPPQLDEKRKTGSPYWTLAFNSTERERDLQLVTAWFDRANRTAINGLRESLLKRAESLDTTNQFQTEDLKRQLNYQLEDYKKSIDQTLATLDEQAKIARSLGIAKATIEGTTFSGNASVVTNLKSDNPLYLRGYEALEREAKLIRERKDERQFIPKIVEIEAQLRSVQDSQTSDRLRELLKKSPLGESGFQFSQTDLLTLQFKRRIGRLNGALLGSLAGGFLGVLFAFMVPAIQREIRIRRTG